MVPYKKEDRGLLLERDLDALRSSDSPEKQLESLAGHVRRVFAVFGALISRARDWLRHVAYTLEIQVELG